MADQPRDDEDPWIIPLHGIAAPGKDLPPKPAPMDEEAVTAHFYDDEELPTLEFRPRLRRSA